MLHVMLGHGSGSGSAVTIRRAEDEVIVGVLLGPDGAATADAERAWLSRMAVRYGGRYELEGSSEVLALPAEGVEARDDVEKLRKELDEARRQGEAYARELAAVFAAGDEPGVAQSSYPPPASPASDRHGAVARLSGGIAAALRSMLSPVGRDLAELRTAVLPPTRKSSPDLENVARVDLEERLESIRRKLLAVQEFVAELAAVGETDPHEPQREVDLAEIVQAEVKALEPRAARAGVEVRVRRVPADAPALARAAPRAAGVLVRELVSHAIVATPRQSAVTVTVMAPASARGGSSGRLDDRLGARIVVDDAGTILPAGARRALLSLEVEPGTFGRPSSVALFVAAEIASAQGAHFEIADSPLDDAPPVSGEGPRNTNETTGPRNTNVNGVRVSVTFPR
jgi:signal transduction histidine kinase